MLKIRLPFFIALILFSGCAIAPSENEPPINAFELSEQCPRVCWMGIQPGVTTRKEAWEFLQSSEQVDQKSIRSSESGFGFSWFVDRQKKFYYKVGIGTENDVVSVLSFQLLKKISLGDLIAVFGEPSEISIADSDAPDHTYLVYILYYPEIQVVIEGPNYDYTGPQAHDFPQSLGIYLERDSNKLPNWHPVKYAERQPWLGYGHIEEYLPGVILPEKPSEKPSEKP